MEKKMFLALALSMLVLIGWPFLFNNKKNKTPVQETQTKEQVQVAESSPIKETPKVKITKMQGGQTYFIENPYIKVGVNSKGATISQVVFKDYKDEHKNFIRFFGSDVETTGAVHISGLDNINMKARQNNPNEVSFYDDKGTEVSYVLDKDSYVISLSVKRSSKEALQFRVYSKVSDVSDEHYGLSEDPDKRKKEVLLYSVLQDKVERTELKDILEKGVIYFTNTFKWAAISDRYFMLAILSDGKTMSDVSSTCIQNERLCSTSVSIKETGPVSNLKLFVGPKDVTYMRKVDPTLSEAIDYGWLSFISVPMLELMKFFYSIIANYGVAILILTLLVRLLMFPLQHKAMKSMKRMQELQPHLKSLQEKYKDDKEKLNREMLSFMKTHKMNPMSGCLPILIQLPVFIALYKVLANSVELYRSPFMFWITDLSMKDHYYILPLLMGGMMFVQQKMTPNPTMDPTQAKIMLYMMPVIFTVLMLNLPSGLTLYIMFSTLLGIVQQIATNKILEAKK